MGPIYFNKLSIVFIFYYYYESSFVNKNEYSLDNVNTNLSI